MPCDVHCEVVSEGAFKYKSPAMASFMDQECKCLLCRVSEDRSRVGVFRGSGANGVLLPDSLWGSLSNINNRTFPPTNVKGEIFPRSL